MTFQPFFFLKLCSKLPPISVSAWCSGNNILLKRCSPTSYQCKQQAHSLPNESPGELTLLACCLDAFQILRSLSFGFPGLLSHTITLSAAALVASLKLLGNNLVRALLWPVFCLDVTGQCNSSGSSGVAVTLTQWVSCYHCGFLSQWSLSTEGF